MLTDNKTTCPLCNKSQIKRRVQKLLHVSFIKKSYLYTIIYVTILDILYAPLTWTKGIHFALNKEYVNNIKYRNQTPQQKAANKDTVCSF